MPIAAIIDTMTVTPITRPTLALVLSVELDLGVELAVATTWLTLALEDVVVIIAAAEVGEMLVVKEFDDEDWLEDWVEGWVEDWVEDSVEDSVETSVEDRAEDWAEDSLEDGDVLDVVVEVKSVEVGCDDGRREPVAPSDIPMTYK